MSFPAEFQTFYIWLMATALFCMLALWLAWCLKMGALRGSLAALCRVGWVLPLFLSFFPETTTEELPRALNLKPIHVLIDDSDSMRRPTDPSSLATAQELRSEIEDQCHRFGCLPKFSLLSEQDDDTLHGYTPLSRVLESWLYKIGSEPWLLISDGGDFKPTEKWSPLLRGLGRAAVPQQGARGLIVGFKDTDVHNVWIKNHEVPPFSFEDKPLLVDVTLRRAQAHEAERVQLQVLAEDQPLATVNAVFAADELETQLVVTVPPLPRGQHLLTIKALPTAAETTLWDNAVHASLEVLPNTVGVLHLLGSPSWDGRFLRRYLKSEPKYDLISFFILRDPWDSQQVNERELSLIPFPVERLFKEELPNFRVVVIQNFTLFQFLLPEYQQNLVRFVQEGGGLLFLGGPRALSASDLMSSPLKAILPFELADNQAEENLGSLLPFSMDPEMGLDESGDSDSAESTDDGGLGYDEKTAFKVEMAKPEASKRALANVYDDWEQLAENLTSWGSAKGLHHMERVTFKPDTTPLLNARVGEQRIPLAVASYPGKGRALWFFSDALWRLAMTSDGEASRQVYNQFMQGAMTWLMRQDLRKPLVASNMSLQGGGKRPATWRVYLQGPAARYFQPSNDWKLTVCGKTIAEDRLVAVRHSDEEWELSGPLPVSLAGGQRCMFEVEGNHAAFGSVKTTATAVFPQIYKDSEIGGAPPKLEDLAQLTGATLTLPPEEPKAAVLSWLEKSTGQEGVALPSRFKTLRNFYWILDRPWIWLLLCLMPLEVVIRRWDQLFGMRERRA